MKRLKLTIFLVLLLCGPAWGATRKVQYVDTDVVGGAVNGSSWANAYPHLSLWEGQNTNLVTADNYLDVYCRASSGTGDVEACVISDWTTNATCNIRIHLDPNNYHNGVYNSSLYRMAPPDMGTPLTVWQAYTVIDGLQFVGVSGTARMAIQLSNANLTMCNCILLNFNAANWGLAIAEREKSGGTQLVYNNIIYNCLVGIGATPAMGNSMRAYNNTVSGCTTGIKCTYAGADAALVQIKNNLVKGGTTCYSLSAAYTTATNYASDATSPDNGIYDNATITFVSVSDFHLDSTMSGTLLGTDLSVSFTTDIDGETRASWYAGADEIAATTVISNWWWRRHH